MTHHGLCFLDEIQEKFPWYKEIMELLKKSPVLDNDTILNSTTPLDLSVLKEKTKVSTPAGVLFHVLFRIEPD